MAPLHKVGSLAVGKWSEPLAILSLEPKNVQVSSVCQYLNTSCQVLTVLEVNSRVSKHEGIQALDAVTRSNGFSAPNLASHSAQVLI